MILKVVPPHFRFAKKDLCKVPIWIRLPSLPLSLWSKKCLSKTLARLGTPICMDSFTTNRKRLAYARALVEIDISKPIKRSIKLNIYGDFFYQPIEYEFSLL